MDKPFEGQSDVSLAVSSNLLNMITWLVNDAHLLNLKVTDETLGPDPPIHLDTTSLSILVLQFKRLPNLRQTPSIAI